MNHVAIAQPLGWLIVGVTKSHVYSRRKLSSQSQCTISHHKIHPTLSAQKLGRGYVEGVMYNNPTCPDRKVRDKPPMTAETLDPRGGPRQPHTHIVRQSVQRPSLPQVVSYSTKRPVSLSCPVSHIVRCLFTMSMSSQITMEPQEAFPFMQLPTEIRLMIYECIPVQVKQHDFNTVSGSAAPRSFAVISKSIDLSILLVSRKVHAEASNIIQRKLDDILQTPPRWIIDLSININIHKCGGPLWHMSRYLAKEAVKAKKSLGSVPYLGTGMGVSGARYNPENDPQHAKLAQLTEKWFQSLIHQRTMTDGKVIAVPSIEVALVAREHCPSSVTSRALGQLARILFAEHGGFQFVLRKASHVFPAYTDDVLVQDTKALMVGYARSDRVRAVQGVTIEAGEFERQWSKGGYY
jgi:hypothetical protein